MSVIGDLTLNVIKRIKNDELKIKLIDRFEEDKDRAELINSIRDENLRIKLLDKISKVYYKKQVVKKIINPKIKLDAIDAIDDIKSRIEIVKDFEDLEMILQGLEKIDGAFNKARVVKDKDINIKLQIINRFNNDELSTEIAETIAETDIKLQIIDKVNDVEYKKRIAKTIEDEDIRKKITNEIEDNENYNQIQGKGQIDVERAKKITNIELKLKALDKFEDEEEIVEIAKSIEDSTIQLQLLDKLNNNPGKKELILAIKDEEVRLKAADIHLSTWDIEEIVKTIVDKEIINRYIKNLENFSNASIIALACGNKEVDQERREILNGDIDKQKEIFFYTEYKCSKVEIAMRFAELEKKDALKEILPQLITELSNETILEILNCAAENDNENFIEECMKDKIIFEKIVNAKSSYSYMSEIITKISEQTKFNFFKAKMDVDGNKDILRAYLADKNIPHETIIEELDKIMELSGVDEKDIPQKKEYLIQMYSINNDVIRNIDYKLLDEKYVEKLGLDKINLISCYSDIQKKVLLLSDEELDIWTKCIDDYTSDAKTDDWKTIANSILDNLCSGEYEELISNIQGIEDVNIDVLRCILQGKNAFGIRTNQDISNYEEIKKETTDELIKSDVITEKQQAVLQKVFGIDYSYAGDIIYSYGEDIDSLPESDIKYYIKSLKEILSCNSSEILEEIYQECKEITFVDKAMTERSLKTEYGKLYNDGLLKVEDLESIGENMYSAGTDFRMIIHSVGACRTGAEYRYDNNYKEDWNRPSIKSQYFSTSYIRNDMLGTAGRHKICYGFSNMEPDALMEAGPGDIGSATEKFESGATTKRFLNPDTMIDNTDTYNELSYSRNQNGMKVQPSYIVVFKYNGEIENLEEAKQAQKDWGGLPIVVVDVNECIKSERAKVDAMVEEYRANPNVELAKKIRNKIRNNRQFEFDHHSKSLGSFCKDIDIEQFKVEESEIETEQIVTESDLEENYSLVTPQERKEQLGKMKMIFRNLMQIKQEDREIE